MKKEASKTTFVKSAAIGATGGSIIGTGLATNAGNTIMTAASNSAVAAVPFGAGVGFAAVLSVIAAVEYIKRTKNDSPISVTMGGGLIGTVGAALLTFNMVASNDPYKFSFEKVEKGKYQIVNSCGNRPYSCPR